MKKTLLILLILPLMSLPISAEQQEGGLRGEPEAIAAAEAMVETMGGMAIWAQLQSLHFVHDWSPFHRTDAYREDEILDLTGPRSWVEMRSEVYHRLRAYSPEHRYWNIVNGEFAYAPDERFEAAMKRAPFSIYRIARGIALGDPYYEVTFADGDIPGSQQLEFRGPDGARGGFIILNARHEPIVWATNEYRYTFGPMKRFGNLRVPDWAIYDNGGTRYEMVSLTGSDEPPDPALFVPPAELGD